MKFSWRPQALVHACILLALIACARALPSPLGRAAQTLGATLQMYWPLVAFETEGLRHVLTRLYRKDAQSELLLALLALCVTLPPWMWLAYQFASPAWHASWNGSTLDVTLAAVAQVGEMALIAAQEEWFWRGYVQASLGHGWRAIALTSLLFGACHWAFTGSPLSLATAIPSLLFGLLAARRHRLVACTIVHIGDNVASRLLFATP